MTLRDELRQHLIGTTTGYDEDRVEAIVDLALGLHDACTQHRVGITQVGLQTLEEPREIYECLRLMLRLEQFHINAALEALTPPDTLQ